MWCERSPRRSASGAHLTVQPKDERAAPGAQRPSRSCSPDGQTDRRSCSHLWLGVGEQGTGDESGQGGCCRGPSAEDRPAERACHGPRPAGPACVRPAAGDHRSSVPHAPTVWRPDSAPRVGQDHAASAGAGNGEVLPAAAPRPHQEPRVCVVLLPVSLRLGWTPAHLDYLVSRPLTSLHLKTLFFQIEPIHTLWGSGQGHFFWDPHSTRCWKSPGQWRQAGHRPCWEQAQGQSGVLYASTTRKD